MAIYKGDKEITAIYKGDKPISAIYKGDKLIFSSGTWEQYLYEYIYYSLVPTTINSKTVKDKARVNTIYGNSVVENQMIDKTYLVAQESNILVDTSTGYLEVDLSSYTGYDHTVLSNRTIKVISGHTYLFSGLNSSISSSATTWWVQLRTTTTSVSPSNLSTTNIFTANAGGDCNLLIYTYVNYTANAKVSGYPQLIDLTQMFPINTPTTLTDTRVQALLNRGYVPYNTGTLKSVDVGAISSEPYNLLDTTDIVKGKRLDASGLVINDNTSSYVFINNVVGGRTYRFKTNSQDTLYTMICWYDKDGNFISRTGNTTDSAKSFTIPNNATKIGITCWSSQNGLDSSYCFDYSNSIDLGYKPHTNPQSITFKYQGNGVGTAHDTLEITNSAYVFTKNMRTINGGSYTWETTSYSNVFALTSLNDIKAATNWGTSANCICDIYERTNANNLASGTKDKAIAITPSGAIWVRDTSISTTADMRNNLTNKAIQYELTSSQTITIPKKHLGLVNLGSLDWTLSSNCFYSSDTAISHKAIAGCPAYCIDYQTINIDVSIGGMYNSHGDLKLGLNSTNGRIYITNVKYTNDTDFKNAMQGVYLFYETEDEVADISTQINVEAGGTLTTNWFSWKKNQIVADGNFTNGTNEWYCLTSVYSQNVTNNMMTVTKNAAGAGIICSKSNSDITYTAGHKFVALAQIKPSRNCSLNFDVSTVQTGQSMTANIWNTLSYFANPSSLTNYYFAIAETTNTLQVNDTVEIKNVMLIDLTLAFGAGNEPTNVNDPQIQYIINVGYIPTNTTGIDESISPIVLPNLLMEIKCK